MAHSLGEVVGLALRNLAQCPVELNLMPKSSLQKQQLAQKKPYFLATLGSLVLVALAIGYFSYRVTAEKQAAVDQLTTTISPFQAKESELKGAIGKLRTAQQEIEQLGTVLSNKLYFVEFLSELQRVFETTEQKTRRPGVETGIWVEEMRMGGIADTATGAEFGGVVASAADAAAAASEATQNTEAMERMAKRYGMAYRRMMGAPAEAEATTTAAPTVSNEVHVVNLTCRGISLRRISPRANLDFVSVLADELKGSDFFVSTNTGVTGSLDENESIPTFKVGVTLQLKRPIKLM